jgi:5-dehydro-2-deoxygluconokinase
VADINVVKGFAIGRTIFVDAAQNWFAGHISDSEAVDDMANKFEKLTNAWRRARKLA